jgi:metal-responsive CopG/Arc/MetJ family transcriptional regulator
MKVAVSIPDSIFRDAERLSRRLRLRRSQLYSRALEAYVRQHSSEEITLRMNAAVARLGRKLDPGWGNPGLEVLRRERW